MIDKSLQFQAALREHAPRAVLLVNSITEDSSGNTTWYCVRIRAVIDGHETGAAMELPARDVELALKCNDNVFYHRVVENLSMQLVKWMIGKE